MLGDWKTARGALSLGFSMTRMEAREGSACRSKYAAIQVPSKYAAIQVPSSHSCVNKSINVLIHIYTFHIKPNHLNRSRLRGNYVPTTCHLLRVQGFPTYEGLRSCKLILAVPFFTVHRLLGIPM
jgi:hypothetical protein